MRCIGQPYHTCTYHYLSITTASKDFNSLMVNESLPFFHLKGTGDLLMSANTPDGLKGQATLQ